MTLGDYTVGLSTTDTWLGLVVLAAAVYLAYRAYRPSRDGGRTVLILCALRTLVILVAVSLLVAPRLTISANGVRLPLIAILIDDSESMRILSGDRPRHTTVTDLMVTGVFERVQDRARVRTFRFSEQLQEAELPDSALWRGTATDIATSLDQLANRLQGEGLAGVFLLSDGAHNVGQSPLQTVDNLSTPLYSVLVGAGQPPLDVAVTAATHPTLGYVGRAMEIRVTIESVGLDRTDHMVRVYDGERPVSVAPVALASGRQEVVLNYTPESPGERTLRVTVPAIEGEVEATNNQVLSRVEVLEGRARVLLIGTPSEDFAYVRRVIEADSNVVLDVVYPDSPQGWGYGARTALTGQPFDLIVLHDVPQALLSTEVRSSLVEIVRAGGGVLVVGGEEGTAESINDLLPVESGERGYEPLPLTARLRPDTDRHPIVRLTDDPVADREAWSGLPPFTGTNHLRVRAQSGARTLVESEHGDPLVVVGNVDRGKVAVIGARGFARQARMMWGIGETDQVVRSFWSNTVRWLLTKEAVRKLRVTTEKDTYRSGEPITFRVELFDDLLRPVDGAEVLLDLEDGHSAVSIVPGRGQGIYEVRSPGLTQGRHPYTVTAQSEGEDAEVLKGEVVVGRYSVEFENLLVNAPLMEGLARRTGGRFVDPDSVSAFVDGLKLSPQPHVSVHRFDLWGKQWPLVLLVLGLTAEWFVRRRRGML